MPQTQLELVVELVQGGRFSDALEALSSRAAAAIPQTASSVLRAELLERVGRLSEAEAACHLALKARSTRAEDKPVFERVLARISWEQGNTELAIDRMIRSVRQAAEVKQFERQFWSQIRLAQMLSERSDGTDAVPVLRQLRHTATRLGDLRAWAALHVFAGVMDAQRGLLFGAYKHCRMAEQLLASSPNVWLEGVCANTLQNIAAHRFRLGDAVDRASEALRLAELSGAAGLKRACLGNLGHLAYLHGNYEEAEQWYHRAEQTLATRGAHGVAALIGLAEIRLARSDPDSAAELLQKVESAVQTDNDLLLYPFRYAMLAKARVLLAQERPLEALSQTSKALAIAKRSGDPHFRALVLLSRAACHCAIHDCDALALALREVGDLIDNPIMLADYEGHVAVALAQDARTSVGKMHFDRAMRFYKGIRVSPKEAELRLRWDEACTATADRPANDISDTSNAPQGARTALHAAAAMLINSDRPELMGLEALDILEQTAAVRGAALLTRDENGGPVVIAAIGAPPPDPGPDDTLQRVPLGVSNGRQVDLIVDPLPDVEAIATVNALRRLAATGLDLERARAEREDKLTLWPFEDTAEDSNIIIGGQMREIMAIARRIANTKFSVLITGESGTGKEVIARAVHAFSNRSTKPFIAFNCSAVPRDMVESQLFGHARGAFTGAEKDSLGLIRTAQGGTLFLDEIGELQYDLQPKLLRFLESGEILPLGERPQNVECRIIAATNASLDDLVRDGKFREDLFYRLNVIRIPIPPLRDRRDEIPMLVGLFLARATANCDRGQLRLAEPTMEHLLAYRWPGNVRQLLNEINRMVALAEPNTVLEPSALTDDLVQSTGPAARAAGPHELIVSLTDKLVPTITRIEREMVRLALGRHRNVDAAARALGISRKGLYLKRQRLGL